MTFEQQCVLEFSKKFNSDCPDVKTIPPEDVIASRLSLLREEVLELEEACRKSIVYVAHEMADVLYLAYGTAIACGIEMQLEAFPKPVRNPQLPFRATINYHLKMLSNYLDVLEEDFSRRNVDGIEVDLFDLRFTIFTFAYYCGIDLIPVFAEIHKSNMTKEPGQKREDGKILKTEKYSPPNIESIILEQTSKYINQR